MFLTSDGKTDVLTHNETYLVAHRTISEPEVQEFTPRPVGFLVDRNEAIYHEKIFSVNAPISPRASIQTRRGQPKKMYDSFAAYLAVIQGE